MEVASGDYGDMIGRMVAANEQGKCNQNGSPAFRSLSKTQLNKITDVNESTGKLLLILLPILIGNNH